MTTHQLSADDDFNLDDFMSELDRDLKKSVDKPKVKRSPIPVAAPFVQQWHPFGLKWLMQRQTCECGAEFQQIQGMYLVDMTKNGAIRSTLHTAGSPLPEPYRYFQPTAEEESSIIASCPWCYAPEPMPAAEPPQLPARPLSQEDREALKDLDQLMEE